VAATAALAAGGVAGAGAYALATGGQDESGASQSSIPAPAATPVADTDTGTTIGEAYERVADGVVEIAVAGSPASSPFGGGQTEGVGAGFVLDDEGNIVTNDHVVDGADSVTVTFASGEEAEATLVGEDASTDIAVLHVDLPAAELEPLTLGSSAGLAVGDALIAVGSPFGLEGTVTSGIVSALGRTIDAPNGYPITGAIQTDAAINPGNSGGPLLDAAGDVVGVNVQIASESGGNDGVGFAVPIDTVKQVVSQLVSGESVEHAYLGVSLTSANGGATIAEVQDGSPAAEASLASGDVVTAVDDTPVASAEDLSAAVAAHAPGDSVTLAVTRAGESVAIEVTLGVRPA
jgi:putative serine protease PepD